MRTPAAAIAIAVATLAAAAHADTPAPAPAPAPDAKEQARVLVQNGVALLKKKDFVGALAAFKQAYARYPSSKILLNLGTTLKALGRNADAANTYQRYLDAPDTDPTRRPEIEDLLVELDKGLARLGLHITPADAEMQLNLGEWTSSRRPVVRVGPGTFQIKVRRKGYAPAERRGDAPVGIVTEVSINLIAEPEEESQEVEVVGGVKAKPLHGERWRSRFGASAGALVDPINGGAAATVGALVTIVERVEINAAALLGPSYGAYIGGTGYILLDTRWRPLVAAGVPLFFSDGTRVSLRVAAGVELIASPHLSVIADVGVERQLNPEADIDAWTLVPSIGVHGRL